MTAELKNKVFDASDVANLVIEDTLFSAHTTVGLSGDDTVQETLDLMQGPQADEIVQSLMSKYCLAGAETRLLAYGSTDVCLDSRLLAGPLRLTANDLKEELISGLKKYLGLPPQERDKIIDEIEKEREL